MEQAVPDTGEPGIAVAAEKSPSKIPLVPRNVKPSTLRNSKTATPHSKIPKRDVGGGSVIASKPVSRIKSVDSKKSSKSTLSLRASKSPLTHSLAPTKSTINNSHRLVRNRDITPRSQASVLSSDRSQKIIDRVAAKKNVLVFTNIREKVRSYQTEFMRKWEIVKNDLPPDEGEYKLIGLVKDNEGQLLAKNNKIKIRAAEKDLGDFKKELQKFVQNNVTSILDSIDQLKASSSGKIGDTSGKDLGSPANLEDIKKKIQAEKASALEDMLKLIDTFEASDSKVVEQPPMDPDLEAKISKLTKELDLYRKSLDQRETHLARIKKGEEVKEALHRKQLEERDKELATKQHELDETKTQLDVVEKSISKEKAIHRELQEKLNSKSKEVEDLEKRLKSSCQTKAAHEYEATIKKLKDELKAANERQARTDHKIDDQATKYADEIRSISDDLRSMKKAREVLQKEINSLRKDAEQGGEIKVQLASYKDKAKQAEGEIQDLRKQIKELESKLQSPQIECCVYPDVQEELCRLQKNDVEKSQKIELLEMELTKAHFQNQKLEEKIVMDRKLLKVRCSLIESLQNKENTQKIHLEDLFAEINERNSDIQALKTELLTKTEEFQNLFSTLGAKQLELTRQEHMIQLLQENNERLQTLRAKQEAKIGRLEEEVTQLKQTVVLYQDAVLPNNVLRKNLLMAATSQENELNDSLGYFVDERRRKRHIDINVKKYEK